MTRAWMIKDILEWTTRYFADHGLPEPRLEAELLLAHVLVRDRVYLYTHYDIPLNKNERDKYKQLILRRAKKEPLAYIIGYKEFMSLKYMVNPDVLIPRPETELLVETALELAARSGMRRVCDVGTGSGAIAISLAYNLPAVDVYATDISEAALAVARENADRQGVEVTFIQGDLLTPLAEAEKFDLITANLPYIPREEFVGLEVGVRGYEPALALLAPGDGLDLYRRLLPACLKLLVDGGYVLLEISPHQADKARAMMPGFMEVEILKDLAGRNRLVKARKEL